MKHYTNNSRWDKTAEQWVSGPDTFCYLQVKDVDMADNIDEVDCPKCKREIGILLRTGGN